ncbi:MAG: hypothetical protein QOH61_738 [Chloroflexota bacterium]|jgi:hypothetical protein|nr:hypothetical protein [Chloroflexota bacterium]
MQDYSITCNYCLSSPTERLTQSANFGMEPKSTRAP